MPANAHASSSTRPHHAKPYQKAANPGKQQQQQHKGKGGKGKHKQQPSNRNPDESKFGVSKIKSLIRQSTRLLQKEKIDPALKIATERRLESLQADLKKAELRNVEKKNHERYHMIRFFGERALLSPFSLKGLFVANTSSPCCSH